MTEKNLNAFVKSAKAVVLSVFTLLFVLAGTVLADDVTLNMEGDTATVAKGNTVTRKIFGIPNGIPGALKLKFKWHAVNIIPNTFNQLKLEVKHGETSLKLSNCFSIHSDKSPKCDFSITVSDAEANKIADWKVTVTNNSDQEVIGFDIAKGSDVNPFVPNFKSVYTPDCPNTVNLDMEGTTLTLGKGNTQERTITGIGKAAGVIRLRIKWHAIALLPTYNRLTIELFDSNGNKVAAGSGSFFSFHAPTSFSPRYDVTINATAAQASGPNKWKLKITNNSDQEVLGFNIAKESADLNPLVPSFTSTYKATCQ